MSTSENVTERNASHDMVVLSANALANPVQDTRDDYQHLEKSLRFAPGVEAIPEQLSGWTASQENPLNWSLTRKSWHVFVVGLTCWLVTFGTSISTPSTQGIAKDFSVSAQVTTLELSLYSLGLGAGPCIGAPLSETFGRWIVFALAIPMSALFTLGAGLSKTISSLLICRFFAGLTGGPPLSIGGGVLADMFPAHKRAVAGSIFIAAPFLGPCTGPLIGGFVAQYTDWRWTQWTILFATVPIFGGICTMRETYYKILISRQEKRLRIPRSDQSPTGWLKVRMILTVTLLRPLHMLLFEPIVTFLGMYTSFIFGVLFMFFAAFPVIFQGVYGFDVSQLGLSFAGTGVGVLLSMGTNILIDRLMYQRQVRKSWENGGRGVVPPEHRLYSAMFGSCAIPVALFWFGWSAKREVHWVSPILATVPFAWGNLSIFHAVALYSTDVYGALNGASALAANGRLRYTISAAFPLFAVQNESPSLTRRLSLGRKSNTTYSVYEKLGIGWASSLLGIISLLFLPLPFILYKWGGSIRKNSRYETTRT